MKLFVDKFELMDYFNWFETKDSEKLFASLPW